MTAQHPSDATVQPIVVDASAGRDVQAGPMMFRIIEDGSHTSGTHAVLEFTLNGQLSPPPHIHRQHEEVIYVLEGEMALPVGDQTIRLGPGAAFVTPIGLAHTFSNGGEGVLRFLLTISPASHLGYFKEAAGVIRAAQAGPTHRR